MHNLSINSERLLDRIRTLGDIGRDESGRLTQLVAFNDARTVKLAKRWMAAGRDLSDVPLGDPTFSLMSLR